MASFPPTIPCLWCPALLFSGFTPHWHWFVVEAVAVAVDVVVVLAVVVVIVFAIADEEHLTLECQSQALRAWFHRSPAGQVCSWGVP